MANIIGYDLYEQIAIDSIYEMTAVQSMPYSTKEFIAKEEALNWLLVAKQVA
ncbi:hypothetical protein [Pontibacter sp. H249]|uniref:hypothetical protein n=1 Tax=Pontibacter sp. H249 TaxID=3133420 RepID=UPI0030C059C0